MSRAAQAVAAAAKDIKPRDLKEADGKKQPPKPAGKRKGAASA